MRWGIFISSNSIWYCEIDPFIPHIRINNHGVPSLLIKVDEGGDTSEEKLFSRALREDFLLFCKPFERDKDIIEKLRELIKVISGRLF